MEKNKLSIIMPVYNVIDFLEKAISSVLLQTYKNIELILVDDGSTDGSKQMCQYLSERDSRIKLICKKNEGVSAARNDGLRIATGDYITFADSDDWLELDSYEKMMDYLLKNGADICVMGYTPEGNDSFVRPLQKEDEQVLLKSEAVDKIIAGKVYTWSIWDKIYRKDLLMGIDFNKEIFNGEDLLFNWQVFRKASKVAYIPLHGYHYVQRMSSMTNTFSVKKMSVIKAFEFIMSDCEKEEMLFRQIQYKYISVLIDLINSYLVKCNGFKYKYDFYELKMAKDYLRRNRKIIMESDLSFKKKMAAFLIISPVIITSLGLKGYERLKN